MMKQMRHHIPLARKATAALVLACAAQAASAGPVGDDWSGHYFGGSLGVATETDDEMLRSLHIGRMTNHGSYTTGLEAELADTDITSPAGRVDRVARLKGRIGVVAGRAHIYGVAGLAYMSGDFGGETGYVLGLGAETQLTDRITLGAEMLHHSAANFDGSDEDVSVNTLSGRLSYRF